MNCGVEAVFPEAAEAVFPEAATISDHKLFQKKVDSLLNPFTASCFCSKCNFVLSFDMFGYRG